MTLPSGGTGARRRSLLKSKIRGAPVTLYVGIVPGRDGIRGSWMTVRSDICVGTGLGVLTFKCALVIGLGLVGGDMHHCSINKVFRSRIILMRMTIITLPLDLVSHRLASALRQRSDSERPASMTIVGQSSSPDRHHRGLYDESPSLEKLDAEHLPAPRGIKLPIGRPIPSTLRFILSPSEICAVSCNFKGITLMINSWVSV
jgi:hypothetical protein